MIRFWGCHPFALPCAQRGTTRRRTHNANYALYHIGQPATAGVKQFAETGKTELLDSNAGEQQQQQMQAGQKPQDQNWICRSCHCRSCH
ncbi:hypothetical protein ACLKA6_017822 [Drosophila palustris]